MSENTMKEITEAATGALDGMKDAFGNFSEAFATWQGKCPTCRHQLAAGNWLKWCTNRACGRLIGPK